MYFELKNNSNTKINKGYYIHAFLALAPLSANVIISFHVTIWTQNVDLILDIAVQNRYVEDLNMSIISAGLKIKNERYDDTCRLNAIKIILYDVFKIKWHFPANLNAFLIRFLSVSHIDK